MIYFCNLLTFIIFALIGVTIAKTQKKLTNYNCLLLLLTILSFGVGKHTSLFKFSSFQINLSIALSSLFLGILIKNLTIKYSLNKKFLR